jgi:hypothetical protein
LLGLCFAASFGRFSHPVIQRHLAQEDAEDESDA